MIDTIIVSGGDIQSDFALYFLKKGASITTLYPWPYAISPCDYPEHGNNTSP